MSFLNSFYGSFPAAAMAGSGGGGVVLPAVGTGAIWDISDLSTLFVERTGASATTAASVNGVVGTVIDASGNGWHLTAPSDAARPILRQAGSLYYLEHDGTDDYFNIGSGDLSSLGTTAVFGIALDPTTDTAYIILGDSADYYGRVINDTNATFNFSMPTTADIHTIRVDGVDKDTGPGSGSTYRRDDLLNDLAAGTAHVVTFENVYTPELNIGSSLLYASYISTTYFDGYFYGGYISDGSFSSGERDDAEAWLAGLSGVTL